MSILEKQYALHNVPIQLQQHIESLLASEQNIAKHGFYPFVAFSKEVRLVSIKHKLDYYKNILPTLKGIKSIQCREYLEDLASKKLIKKRDIKYPFFVDRCIYYVYAKILNKHYESRIQRLNLHNEILAYRQLPTININGKDFKQNNCTMAREVFMQIKARDNKCFVLKLDIKGFFDNICHKNLYKEWAGVLGLEKLPKEHLNIFKSLTKYCFIAKDEIALYRLHKRTKSIKNFKDFRLWYKATFGKTFHKNPNSYGIPQGASISCVLSNIYMIPFDIECKKIADSINGIYRRYVDDMIFICNTKRDIVKITQAVHSLIKQRGASLEIHKINTWDKYSKSQIYNFNNIKAIKRNPLQYLGFYFDGENVRVRETTIANYMRKSHNGIIAMKIKAKERIKNMHEQGIEFHDKHRKLFRRALYDRYTHLGAANKNPNFISYIYNAFDVFDDSVIKRQIKQHFKRFNTLLKEADSEICDYIDSL